MLLVWTAKNGFSCVFPPLFITNFFDGKGEFESCLTPRAVEIPFGWPCNVIIANFKDLMERAVVLGPGKKDVAVLSGEAPLPSFCFESLFDGFTLAFIFPMSL